MLSYCIFEEENQRYRTNDYFWESNKNGNLIGKEIETGETKFTWQPHGSQFTIHTKVPQNAIKFTIKKPMEITKNQLLNSIGFDKTWIKIMK